MFIVLLKFKKPIEEVAQYGDAHIAFLKKYYTAGKLIVSGWRKNDTDKRIIGDVIIAYQLTRTELETILLEDPFHQHQVVDYEITEFVPMFYEEAFRPFIT